MFEKRVTVLVGHFGSGKTEIALNGALDLAAAGEAVTLADLDVVKPYFRSRSGRALLADAGVRLLAPEGESIHSDLPIIVPESHSGELLSIKYFSGDAILPKRVELPRARPAHSFISSSST